MDKATLSNYGWVVICVLVLVVMIALATPFGNFIATAVKNTTQGLFSTSQNALNTGLAGTGVTVEAPADIVVDGEAQAPQIQTINFTIDGISYQAEEGMTWGEWIAQSNRYFDDDLYYCTDYGYVNLKDKRDIQVWADTHVKASDIINASMEYKLVNMGAPIIKPIEPIPDDGPIIILP